MNQQQYNDALRGIISGERQLIVSKKVVEILQEICPEDIQIFEANVYIGEKKIPDYYLLNIVSAIEVIDKTESEFTTIKGTDSILNFKKVVYKFDGLPNNHHLVRNLYKLNERN